MAGTPVVTDHSAETSSAHDEPRLLAYPRSQGPGASSRSAPARTEFEQPPVVLRLPDVAELPDVAPPLRTSSDKAGLNNLLFTTALAIGAGLAAVLIFGKSAPPVERDAAPTWQSPAAEAPKTQSAGSPIPTWKMPGSGGETPANNDVRSSSDRPTAEYNSARAETPRAESWDSHAAGQHHPASAARPESYEPSGGAAAATVGGEPQAPTSASELEQEFERDGQPTAAPGNRYAPVPQAGRYATPNSPYAAGPYGRNPAAGARASAEGNGPSFGAPQQQPNEGNPTGGSYALPPTSTGELPPPRPALNDDAARNSGAQYDRYQNYRSPAADPTEGAARGEYRTAELPTRPAAPEMNPGVGPGQAPSAQFRGIIVKPQNNPSYDSTRSSLH